MAIETMLVGRQAHNWSGVEQDAMQSPDLTVARRRNISWPATGIMLEFVAGNWRIRAGSGPASEEAAEAGGRDSAYPDVGLDRGGV